jgi:hypothetical protein
VRSYLARRRVQARAARQRAYHDDVLHRIDARDVMLRALRLHAARRRVRRLGGRTAHLTDQRVELESKAVEEDVEEAVRGQGRQRSGSLVAGNNTNNSSYRSVRIRTTEQNLSFAASVFMSPFKLRDARSQNKLDGVHRASAARIVQGAWRLSKAREWKQQVQDAEEYIQFAARKIAHPFVNEEEAAPRETAGTLFDLRGVRMEQSEMWQTTDTDMGAVVDKAVSFSESQARVAGERSSSRRPSRTPSELGGSGRGLGRFQPLKVVKLSALEAERRAKEAEAERQRVLAQEQMQRMIALRRAERKRKTQAALLMQRVCRAYRRRMFLYAKKLANSGGRFLSANPFMRRLSRHHGGAAEVPLQVHTVITALIEERAPHLIPATRARLQAERERRAAVVQCFVRAKDSAVLRCVMRRFAAARAIQRWWWRWQYDPRRHSDDNSLLSVRSTN